MYPLSFRRYIPMFQKEVEGSLLQARDEPRHLDGMPSGVEGGALGGREDAVSEAVISAGASDAYCLHKPEPAENQWHFAPLQE